MEEYRQRPFAFPFCAQPLGLLQLEVSTHLKTYFQVLKWFNQQQKWFQPSREVNVAALLSWFLPWLPFASWAFSTLHQVLLAWSSPPGAHHHLHPCCQHSACHPQQALVKAASSELNSSPLLMRFNLTWWFISRVLLKQSANSWQAQVWSLTYAGILKRLKVALPTFPSVPPVFRLATDWHDFVYVQALSPFTKMIVKKKL